MIKIGIGLNLCCPLDFACGMAMAQVPGSAIRNPEAGSIAHRFRANDAARERRCERHANTPAATIASAKAEWVRCEAAVVKESWKA